MPLVFGGCSDDDGSGEINFGKGDVFVEKDINGIEFKFCLLNEKGKPADTFKEGENFYFYFSIKNNSERDYYYDHYECSVIKDFLRVYNNSGLDIGKSYKPLLQTMPGIGRYPFKQGDIYIFRVPWLHESHDEETVLSGGDYHYQSVYQNPLSKGNYHTGFEHQFFLVNNPEVLSTGTLNFNINFSIQ